MITSIKSALTTRWAGQSIYYYEETDSTNIQAKALEGAGHGTLVVADMQTAGRGRLGRTWQSPAGNNIYMSILLKPEISPNQAPMLTLVMALSVAEAVKTVSGMNAYIKWPNDLVINKKKICGILTEMNLDGTGIKHVVIGVGINVNTPDFPEDIRQTATSLRIEGGHSFERAEIIAAIMESFEKNYEIFIQNGDLSGIVDKYNALLANKNKEVRVLEPGHEYNGYALGINNKGELLVRREDGTVENVFAGEVSVRGIYGYV